MKPDYRKSHLLAVLALLWSAAVPGAESSVPAPATLSLDEAVRESVARLVVEQRVADPITALTVASRLGGAASVDRSTYTWTDDRLLAEAYTSQAAGGGAVTHSQSLSLCGLHNLLSAGGASSTSTMALPVPMGQVLVPFGFRLTHDAGHTQRVVKLEADTGSICPPKPGSKFSLRTRAEVVVTMGGLFGGRSANTFDVLTRCSISEQEKDAGLLQSALRGTYLDVACEVEQGGSVIAERQFAFLRDSGFYLILRSKGRGGDVTHSIQAVEYSVPGGGTDPARGAASQSTDAGPR